jgi:hypothetical protein
MSKEFKRSDRLERSDHPIYHFKLLNLDILDRLNMNHEDNKIIDILEENSKKWSICLSEPNENLGYTICSECDSQIAHTAWKIVLGIRGSDENFIIITSFKIHQIREHDETLDSRTRKACSTFIKTQTKRISRTLFNIFKL